MKFLWLKAPWIFAAGLLIASSPLARAATLQEALDDLKPLEAEARYFKFEGMLQEGDACRLQGRGAIPKSAEALVQKLNQSRADYFPMLAKQLGISPSDAIKSYAERISRDDDKELTRYLQDILFTVDGTPSVSEKLLPALISAYLASSSERLTSVSSKWRQGEQYIYGTRADTRLASVRLSTASTSEVRQALSAKKCEAALCSKEDLPADMLRGEWLVTPVAEDGIGVIVNPQNSLEEISAADFRTVLLRGGSWNSLLKPGERGGPASGPLKWRQVGQPLEFRATLSAADLTSPPGAVIVKSYEELDQQVFEDPQAIGLVPLGVAWSTDNKVLRVVANPSFPHGYRPTPLTVMDQKYPWIRHLVLIQRNDPAGARSAAVQKFARFCTSAEGQAVVLKRGFAPAINSKP